MADDAVAETPDSGDRSAEENQRKEARRRARADADVMRGILRTAEGRDWLYRKLRFGGLYGDGTEAPLLSPGQPDVTAERIGRLNFAAVLDNEALGASLDLHMQMLKEQRDDARRLEDLRRKEREAREAAARPPIDVDAMAVHLPPPQGYPGHVPPKPIQPKGKSKSCLSG
jgi:hypothetical protein